MPRRPRIHLPGVPIHLVQRGQNREACFFTDEAFLAYREWLGDALKKTGCTLHAYVLMTNHVHLLLTPPSFLLFLSIMAPAVSPSQSKRLPSIQNGRPASINVRRGDVQNAK